MEPSLDTLYFSFDDAEQSDLKETTLMKESPFPPHQQIEETDSANHTSCTLFSCGVEKEGQSGCGIM